MNWQLALRLAETVVHAAAAGSAWARAAPGRRLPYLPAARKLWAFLAASLAADGARALLQGLVLARHPRPFVGWARAAFHAEQSLFIGWPFGLAALLAVLFRRPDAREWPRLATYSTAWATTCALLASRYPELRGASLGETYGQIEAALLCAAVAHLFGDPHEGPWLDCPRRAALWLLVADGATLAGPYLARSPFALWWLAQVASVVAYLLITRELFRGTMRR